MAEYSNESEGSATLEGDLHENEVEKETCESSGSSLIPSELLSKLQEIKNDFTFNWRDHGMRCSAIYCGCYFYK